MGIEEYQEQLRSVNRAIAAIEGGAQEYRLGSRTVRRGELATLYGERRRLEGILAQASPWGGGTTLANFRREW